MSIINKRRTFAALFQVNYGNPFPTEDQITAVLLEEEPVSGRMLEKT